MLLEVSAASLDADPERGERFEADVLAPWAADFGRALERESHSPLYRAAGALLSALHATPNTPN